jgi:hypothetical protein
LKVHRKNKLILYWGEVFVESMLYGPGSHKTYKAICESTLINMILLALEQKLHV